MASLELDAIGRGRRASILRAAAAGLVIAVLAAGAAGLRADSAVRPPRLDAASTTLPNGLRVILLEDHSTPIVSVQVWYHVGSKDEQAGRTGFAHLLEHMMFRGSKNVRAGQHTSLITGFGGESNAETTEDVTVFWETVPSQYLPAALWLEADRMATLRLDKETFSRERDVVKEERLSRIENQPYGRMAEIVLGQAFTVHPYKHQPMGAMDDLEAASIDDVRAFFRAYYVPANATLVIAGDIDSRQATDLATQYFGRIPRPDRPVPRDIPAEPAPKGPRRVTVEEKWPLPVVVVAHHIVAGGHPDSYPLRVAGKILSDGQSSRLYSRLVYGSGIALAAAGVGNFLEDPGLFYAFAVVQPGHTPAEAERALVEELERLQSEPVSNRELTRAKNQLARDAVLGRETVHQKAAVLARAAIFRQGDLSAADAEIDTLQNVSAADVQRVARSYFAPQGRLVITVLRAPAKEPAR